MILLKNFHFSYTKKSIFYFRKVSIASRISEKENQNGDSYFDAGSEAQNKPKHGTSLLYFNCDL